MPQIFIYIYLFPETHLQVRPVTCNLQYQGWLVVLQLFEWRVQP